MPLLCLHAAADIYADGEERICMKKILCLFIVCTFIFGVIPVYAQEELEINAKAALLMEASTGEILYSKNPDMELPIASVTKIMTMLLIMEAVDNGQISLDDTVTASERAKSMGGSTMFLDTGEQLPVSDMLKGIAVASANDGAVAMAEHIAGSEGEFVRMMNERAQSLSMEHTSFKNTNGLDAEGHYSSAHDVAVMSRELIKHEKIFEYTTIWMDTLRDGKFQLANTNKLIRFYKGANGLKTGSTSKALCCLSATAKRDDMQLIAVVLGAPTSKERFAGASKLLDYGFAKYSVSNEAKQGDFAADAAVERGVEDSVRGVYEQSFSALGEKGKQSQIEKVITLEENITAPVEKGQKLGVVEFMRNGEKIGESAIISEAAVERKKFSHWFKNMLDIWLCG